MQLIQIYPGPFGIHMMDHEPVYPTDKASLPTIPCVVLDTSTYTLYYCDDTQVNYISSVWG